MNEKRNEIPAEYEICILTCRSLKNMLKERIRGSIKIRVYNDVLTIKIWNRDFNFVYEEENYLQKAISDNGLDEIANNCVRCFRSAVLGRYFVRENSQEKHTLI